MNSKTVATPKQKKHDKFYDVLDRIIQKDKPTLKTKVERKKNGGGIVVSSHSTKEKAYSKLSISPINTIQSVRSGVNFDDFKQVYDLVKLTNNKWAEIMGISERTMQSVLKEKKNLDQNKSEKLIAFLLLVEYAMEVLGNHNYMMEWLKYKSPALLGNAPVDYLDTFQGITMLKEQLFKIETGNLV